jgi:ribosomal protein S18 acetylase RimI-like enzyme
LDRDAETVYRADNEAFGDHFGHIEMPFEVGFAQFNHNLIDDKEKFDPGLWHVAMDGDEIAGVSICSIERSDPDQPMGWVHTLGVRRAWRKRGLGRALLLHSFGEFYRRGYRKAGLGVDASNLTGALRLYENAGMTVFRQYDRYELEIRPGKELMTTGVSE